jgi:hypothetical protein
MHARGLAPRRWVAGAVVGVMVATAAVVALRVRSLDVSERTAGPPVLVRVRGGVLQVLDADFEVTRAISLPSEGMTVAGFPRPGAPILLESATMFVAVDLVTGDVTDLGADLGADTAAFVGGTYDLAKATSGPLWSQIYTLHRVDDSTRERLVVAVERATGRERETTPVLLPEVVLVRSPSPDAAILTGPVNTGAGRGSVVVTSDGGGEVFTFDGRALDARDGRVLVVEDGNALAMYEGAVQVDRRIAADVFGAVVGGVITGRRTAMVVSSSGAVGRLDFGRGSVEELADFDGAFKNLIVVGNALLMLVGDQGDPTVLIDRDGDVRNVFEPVVVDGMKLSRTALDLDSTGDDRCMLVTTTVPAKYSNSELVDVDNGRVLATLIGEVSRVGAEGCAVAVSDGGQLQLWVGARRQQLPPGTTAVRQVSADGRQAIVADSAGMPQLIDLTSGDVVDLVAGQYLFVQP